MPSLGLLSLGLGRHGGGAASTPLADVLALSPTLLWDPSADGALFVDYETHTTPATSGTVGVLLDIAQGGIDPDGEDLTDTFTPTLDSVWTDNGDGTYTADGSSSGGNIKWVFTGNSPGDVFDLRFTIDSRTSGNVKWSRDLVVSSDARTAPGDYRHFGVSDSTSPAIWLQTFLTPIMTISAVTGQQIPGIHAFQNNASSQHPTLSADGALVFDGTADRIGWQGAAGGLPSDVSVFVHIFSSDTSATLFGDTNGGASTRYLARAVSGSGDTGLCSGAGTPTVWVDGTEVTTRGGLFTAAFDGSDHIVEIREADLSAWPNFYFSGDITSYAFDGGMRQVIIIPTANVDAAARAAVTTYMEG